MFLVHVYYTAGTNLIYKDVHFAFLSDLVFLTQKFQILL